MGATASSNEKVTRLAHELGHAIRRALAGAPEIAACVERIKAEGYEISCEVEATVGFARTGQPETPSAAEASRSEPAPPQMTPLDKKFLRSLKIAIDED
jgi:hypothetical protein